MIHQVASPNCSAVANNPHEPLNGQQQPNPSSMNRGNRKAETLPSLGQMQESGVDDTPRGSRCTTDVSNMHIWAICVGMERVLHSREEELRVKAIQARRTQPSRMFAAGGTSNRPLRGDLRLLCLRSSPNILCAFEILTQDAVVLVRDWWSQMQKARVQVLEMNE